MVIQELPDPSDINQTTALINKWQKSNTMSVEFTHQQMHFYEF